MVIKYIYITKNSEDLAKRLNNISMKDVKFEEEDIIGELISYKEFKSNKKNIFDNADFLVFIMATGIVVRTIADLLDDKLRDPGVVVIDEFGLNVISLIGGHVAGANHLTKILAEKLRANPVITTATDINNKGSLDLIAKKLDADLDSLRKACLNVNSSLVKGNAVNIYIQSDYVYLLENMLNGFNIFKSIKSFEKEYINRGLVANQESFVIISDEERVLSMFDEEVIKIIPRKNMLGVGCRRNIASDIFEKNIIKYLSSNNISIKSIKTIASIDVKKNEKCIIDFAHKYNIEKIFFSPEDLSLYDSLYESSNFVKKTVGVYCVSEPACHIVSDGNIIAEKYKSNGITVSIGRKK
ncbi:MAG: cobalt-precorrin 5A hydrolase [Peptostreptococcus sp.]|uniref:cobalt-precorrin 5A hydrolase n=1 Tax=Peptostreptococcus sp. TaxID=1262 RepID=UPI002FC9B8EF